MNYCYFHSKYCTSKHIADVYKCHISYVMHHNTWGAHISCVCFCCIASCVLCLPFKNNYRKWHVHSENHLRHKNVTNTTFLMKTLFNECNYWTLCKWKIYFYITAKLSMNKMNIPVTSRGNWDQLKVYPTCHPSILPLEFLSLRLQMEKKVQGYLYMKEIVVYLTLDAYNSLL